MTKTTTTNTSGAISGASTAVAQKKKQPSTIKDYISLYEREIAKALPSIMTPERFTRMVMTAITQTPKLADCTPQSFIGAMLSAAQLGLEPNTPLGQAYLIPYGTKCQFQIGYKGFIDLAYRGGSIKKIEAHTVKENDEFEYEFGDNPKLRHKPALNNRGNAIAYYATYKLDNGETSFIVSGREDIESFAIKYSQTYKNGPWQTEFDEMAKKTLIKKLLKYAPIKTELASVMNKDNSFNTVEVIKNNNDDEIRVIPDEVVEVNEVGEVVENE